MTQAMLDGNSARSSENTEEGRAFLQARIALFWKVLCFFMLFASTLGAVGAFKRPGADLWVDIALAAQAAFCWWLARRGKWTVRASRNLEIVGLVIFFCGASLLHRFVLVGFARERALGTTEGQLMADAYMSSLGLVGAALMITIRAALVPSTPRRTLLYTVLVGLPVLLVPTLLVPSASGGLTLRGHVFAWLPAGLSIVWSFVVITCTLVSTVIFGLRTQVRQARRLGQYVLEEKIGEGGMGEVYRAWHGMMRRPTALKLLQLGHAHPKNLVRFEREVQLTARLTHPNTITVFDYGRTEDNIFYYAMELLDGATLQRIVEVDGPQEEGRVVRVLKMVCGALAEAHGIGLIHRDIKPANIMLCKQGGECDVVKLLDFGLVKELSVTNDPGLSIAGAMLGTPMYLAPEAITAPESVDARADIYAVGAVAYYLLSGNEVFSGRTLVEICGAHLHREPQPLADRGVAVSARLEALVRACLEKKPERRPQSAIELKQGLDACEVNTWDDNKAQQWWRTRRSELGTPKPSNGSGPRTIAVADRSHRGLVANLARLGDVAQRRAM